MVILATKLKVVEEDGNLGRRNDKDGKHKKKEGKDVVILIHPHRCQNEVQLHKARAKGQDPPHGEREGQSHEPRLIRDLTGDAARIDGELDRLLLVTKVCAEEDQRRRDPEPQKEEDEHGEGRDGVGTPLGERDDVHDHEESEGDAREAEGDARRGLLPALSLERLVQPGRNVSRHGSHEDVQEELGHDERSAVGGAEESHGRKEDGQYGHAEELRSGAAAYRHEEGGEAGRPEDVGVYELPSELFHVLRLFFVGGEAVVAVEVTTEVAHQNRRDHGTQHNHNDQTIRDTQPMNLGGDGIVHTQVHIPTTRPVKLLILRPSDIVRKEHPTGSRLGLTAAGIHHLVPGVLPRPNFGITALNGILDVRHLVGLGFPLLQGIVVIVRGCLKVVLDAKRLNGEPHHARLIRLRLHRMVLHLNIDMIVHIRLHSITRNKPHGEPLPIPRGHRSIILHLTRRGNIIHNPIIMIILTNGADHLVRTDALLFPPSEVGDAELFAVHVHLHVETIW
mmetsp:Transcript_14604/g.26502  ORF Transcript_14604/g.26502 Transcript_14604/m.26502 type:complete len:507 (+) Transcript_14604:395-1915(+)